MGRPWRLWPQPARLKPVPQRRKVTPVTTVGGLLTAYDEHMRGVQPKPPAGVRYERDGPLLRVAGGHRGYVCGPRDLGVTGAELGRLIARQRDYFAARVLPPAGEEGMPFTQAAPMAADASAARPTALVTGRAGDVFLCHPFLVHAASWPHTGRQPRLIAQPGVALLDAFPLTPPLSPVEIPIAEAR